MQLEFSKMHGLGNDFMVLDLVTQLFVPTPEQIRAWSDRHTGVGFDQLLAIEPPDNPEADFRYRIYNADGSEVEQCGNGARCAALFVVARQLSPKRSLLLETNTGLITVTRLADGMVEVDMGPPDCTPAVLPFCPDAPGVNPVVHRINTASGCADVDAWQIDTSAGPVECMTVSMGNPHAVIFVDNVANAPVAELGQALMVHPAFPSGVNVGFVQVVDNAFLRLRVFERGVGET
ncbi:MAG: diaminopimelate epimerase, partial [Gammaproteobacteria bacterium]